MEGQCCCSVTCCSERSPQSWVRETVITRSHLPASGWGSLLGVQSAGLGGAVEGGHVHSTHTAGRLLPAAGASSQCPPRARALGPDVLSEGARSWVKVGDIVSVFSSGVRGACIESCGESNAIKLPFLLCSWGALYFQTLPPARHPWVHFRGLDTPGPPQVRGASRAGGKVSPDPD